MDKVIIASVEDRLTVAAILVKNDYTCLLYTSTFRESTTASRMLP